LYRYIKQPIIYTDSKCEPAEIKVNFHPDLVKLIRETRWGLYKLSSVYPQLESAWFQPSKLK
jgi:hypothetical protein